MKTIKGVVFYFGDEQKWKICRHNLTVFIDHLTTARSSQQPKAFRRSSVALVTGFDLC